MADEKPWTPGPWLDGEGNTTGRVVTAPEQPKVRRNVAACGGPNRDGNARLIAAAPDLYEALVVAADLCVGTFAENGGPHKQMLAALAKANGETVA